MLYNFINIYLIVTTLFYYTNVGYRINIPVLIAMPPLHNIAVIFVSLDTAEWSKEDRKTVVAVINTALDFWQKGPIPHNAQAFDNGVYRIQENYNELWNQKTNYRTIYVVETRQNQALLWGQAYGYGEFNKLAIISSRTDVTMGIGGPSAGTWERWIGAVTAHELGHMLYGLPDTFLCESFDIMGYPDLAWDSQTIGNCSIEWLK